MTDEEAIETLKVAKSEIEWEYPMDYQIALDKAIKALEQEPSDCISRADAIKALEYSLSIEADGGLDKYKTVIKDLLDAIYDMQKKAIEDLPSIQPKTEVREKGHWVEDIINGKALYSCSECLHTVSNYEGCFHYCPYCGKELKGVVKNDM